VAQWTTTAGEIEKTFREYSHASHPKTFDYISGYAAFDGSAAMKKSSRQQAGAVLLLMLILLILGASALALSAFNANDNRLRRLALTTQSLAQAKEALISYAVTYGDIHAGDVPGFLPCPDLNGDNGEGSSPINCGLKNVSAIGHFPWKTLKLPTLRDGDNQCLWYAVSGTYKNNPQTDLMNWDTNGQFQAFAADGVRRLDGDNNQVVAIIFAPGVAQAGQTLRGSDSNRCGTSYAANAFLDQDLLHGINNSDVSSGKFIQSNSAGLVNDQLLVITRLDIWKAIQRRQDFAPTLQHLSQVMANCLADYGNNNALVGGAKNFSLPWAADLLPIAPDFGNNAKYRNIKFLAMGRVPYDVAVSSKATGNLKITSSGNLMSNNGLQCPYYKATPSNELERLYPWWTNWKDHFFVAIAKAYQPSALATAIGGDNLQINQNNNFAAVVMFAGKSLEGIARASATTSNPERGNPAFYLEGRNASNLSNGNLDFQNEAASATFNDILFCLSDNHTRLSAAPCP